MEIYQEIVPSMYGNILVREYITSKFGNGSNIIYGIIPDEEYNKDIVNNETRRVFVGYDKNNNIKKYGNNINFCPIKEEYYYKIKEIVMNKQESPKEFTFYKNPI